MPMSCPECHSPLTPCYASVGFRGEARQLRLRLNHVPAMWCHHCATPYLEPALRRHLNELGLAPTGGWIAEGVEAA